MERLCLYEWATAGGLDGPDGASLASDPEVAAAVREEGLAMLTALAAAAAGSSQVATRVLLGEGVDYRPPPGVSVVRVPRGREWDGLLAAAAASDWLLPVAPETAGILVRRLRRLSASGCRLLCPTATFAALASDKQATVLALAAAGVPVPAGRRLSAGACPPPEFRRPLVRKRLDSTGCDGLMVVRTPNGASEPAMHAERLEACVEGLPVSVAVLCGSGGQVPLQAVLQRFSSGDRPVYVGGQLPVPKAVGLRAQQLAVRAVRALSRAAGVEPTPAVGWVGVDMILGDREDGRGDRVLEINPRVTTSLVGLVACSKTNLIDAMLTAASGARPRLMFTEQPPGQVSEFTARPSSPSTLAERI